MIHTISYQTAAPPDLSNPFPGLRPFEVAEDHLFFGRDKITSSLLDMLHDHRFVALVGDSGCGKSSLVKAGLMPALGVAAIAEAGHLWGYAYMRPWKDPLAMLARAVHDGYSQLYGKSAEEDKSEGILAPSSPTRRVPEIGEILSRFRASSLGLVHLLKDYPLPDRASLLIQADQFEEVFRLREDEGQRVFADTKRFVDLLLAASAQAEFSVYVVMTMRTEYLGQCAVFEGLVDKLNDCLFVVPRMSRDEMRDAIVGPAKMGGCIAEADLVERVLDEMAALGEAADQLPLMQQAMHMAWNNRQKEVQECGEDSLPLSLRHFTQILSADSDAGVLVGCLNEAGAKILRALEIPCEGDADCDQLRALRWVLRCLAKTVNGVTTRHPTSLRSIVEIVKAAHDPRQSLLVRRMHNSQDWERLVNDAVDVLTEYYFVVSYQTTLESDPGSPEGEVLDIQHEAVFRQWDVFAGCVRDEATARGIYNRLIEDSLAWLISEKARGSPLEEYRSWERKYQPSLPWAATSRPVLDDHSKFPTQKTRSLVVPLATRALPFRAWRNKGRREGLGSDGERAEQQSSLHEREWWLLTRFLHFKRRRRIKLLILAPLAAGVAPFLLFLFASCATVREQMRQDAQAGLAALRHQDIATALSRASSSIDSSRFALGSTFPLFAGWLVPPDSRGKAATVLSYSQSTAYSNVPIYPIGSGYYKLFDSSFDGKQIWQLGSKHDKDKLAPLGLSWTTVEEPDVARRKTFDYIKGEPKSVSLALDGIPSKEFKVLSPSTFSSELDRLHGNLYKVQFLASSSKGTLEYFVFFRFTPQTGWAKEGVLIRAPQSLPRYLRILSARGERLIIRLYFGEGSSNYLFDLGSAKCVKTESTGLDQNGKPIRKTVPVGIIADIAPQSHVALTINGGRTSLRRLMDGGELGEEIGAPRKARHNGGIAERVNYIVTDEGQLFSVIYSEERNEDYYAASAPIEIWKLQEQKKGKSNTLAWEKALTITNGVLATKTFSGDSLRRLGFLRFGHTNSLLVVESNAYRIIWLGKVVTFQNFGVSGGLAPQSDSYGSAYMMEVGAAVKVIDPKTWKIVYANDFLGANSDDYESTRSLRGTGQSRNSNAEAERSIKSFEISNDGKCMVFEMRDGYLAVSGIEGLQKFSDLRSEYSSLDVAELRRNIKSELARIRAEPPPPELLEKEEVFGSTAGTAGGF